MVVLKNCISLFFYRRNMVFFIKILYKNLKLHNYPTFLQKSNECFFIKNYFTYYIGNIKLRKLRKKRVMCKWTGGNWCVCKDGLSDAVLQKSLDYACGAGADCNPIHLKGSCFNPDTVKAHCSYAVNSYFQRKGQAQGSCDFSGTATVTTTDPSNSPSFSSFPWQLKKITPPPPKFTYFNLFICLGNSQAILVVLSHLVPGLLLLSLFVSFFFFLFHLK